MNRTPDSAWRQPTVTGSQEIRTWIYDSLKQGGLDRNLGALEQHVKTKLQECGQFPSAPGDFHRELDTSIKDQIREIVWALVIQGFSYLVPTPGKPICHFSKSLNGAE